MLELDGRNYYNVCRRGVPWATKAPNVEVLTISHFKPHASESFPTYAFMLLIAPMKKLECLDIYDVALRPTVPLPVPHMFLRLSTLELSDFPDFMAIDDMFAVLHYTIEVKLTRCTIGSTTRFGAGGPLDLNEIDADQDLAPLLRAWDGYNLSIHSCPCFNDIVLDMMGTKKEDGEYVCASGAYNLFVSDCPNFLVAALKRLVAARLDAPPYAGPFQMIHVCGDASILSAEDRLWFNERVPEFDYSAAYIRSLMEVSALFTTTTWSLPVPCHRMSLSSRSDHRA
jgi:hypothetical protein